MNFKTLAVFAFGLALADRAAKVFALSLTAPHTLIAPFLELELEKNFGLAWGIGASVSRYAFIFLMGFVLVGFAYKIVLDWCSRITPIAETLVVVGGLSNVFDRLFYGFVIDFIRINIASYSLSVFNLADVYIALGLIFMLQRAWND